MSWVPVLHSPPPSGAHPLKLGPGLAGGGAEPKHKKISDFQGQQFQIALILNGTSGGIRGINISMQSLPFVEAFAEVWVESSWVLLCLCFSPLERNLGCVFIPRTSRGAVFAPQTSRGRDQAAVRALCWFCWEVWGRTDLVPYPISQRADFQITGGWLLAFPEQFGQDGEASRFVLRFWMTSPAVTSFSSPCLCWPQRYCEKLGKTQAGGGQKMNL